MTGEIHNKGPSGPSPWPRLFWLALGHGAFALGLAGAILPLLPTTPFMLLALGAYARSSPRLRARLYAHPRFGPPLQRWHEQGAISGRGKAIAVLAMVASWGIATWQINHPAIPWLMGAVAIGVSAFILTRPRATAPSG